MLKRQSFLGVTVSSGCYEDLDGKASLLRNTMKESNRPIEKESLGDEGEILLRMPTCYPVKLSKTAHVRVKTALHRWL